jgi:hypothetical protein
MIKQFKDVHCPRPLYARERYYSFQTQNVSRTDAFKSFVCKTFEIVFVDDIQNNVFIKMLSLSFCHLTIELPSTDHTFIETRIIHEC